MSKPKIRFKGYEEDWEQRKLSDITLKIGSGKTPSGGKNAYVDDGIPLIRSQNINNDRVDLEDIVSVSYTHLRTRLHLASGLLTHDFFL